MNIYYRYLFHELVSCLWNTYTEMWLMGHMIFFKEKPHGISIIVKAIARFCFVIFFLLFPSFPSVWLTQIFCPIQAPQLSLSTDDSSLYTPAFIVFIYYAVWHVVYQHSLGIYDLSTIIFFHPVMYIWFIPKWKFIS